MHQVGHMDIRYSPENSEEECEEKQDEIEVDFEECYEDLLGCHRSQETVFVADVGGREAGE